MRCNLGVRDGLHRSSSCQTITMQFGAERTRSEPRLSLLSTTGGARARKCITPAKVQIERDSNAVVSSTRLQKETNHSDWLKYLESKAF